MILGFTATGWEDYLKLQADRRLVKKANKVIDDILRNPFEGIGKPEALKHDYAGYWSRRITHAHRIVYRVYEDAEGHRVCRILRCYGHYDD